MGSSDIAKDVAMELPLILFSIMSHIIGIDEVPCYRVNCEGLGETFSSLLVLVHLENADFLSDRWREAAILLDRQRAIITCVLHGCGWTVKVRFLVCLLVSRLVLVTEVWRGAFTNRTVVQLVLYYLLCEV
jgi:hypothetical protein